VHKSASGPWLRGRFSNNWDGIGSPGTACNWTSAAHTLKGLRTCLFPALILLCWPQPSFAQRGLQPEVQGIQDRAATITVNVRLADHSPVEQGVIVNLRTFDGVPLGSGSMRGGLADFSNVPVGWYTVEVIAAGYQRTTEDVEITVAGQRLVADLVLRPDPNPSADGGPGRPPILAPNAQKELSRALEQLRNNKPQEAKKYLDKVSRSALDNPDVSYSWGLYYEQVRNLTKAKSYWEKTVQVYPRHAFALAALGQMARQERDQTSAVGYFERAVEAAPSSPRFELLLAQAYVDHQQYDDARKHAEHAIELGKDRATEAQLVLAEIQLRQNQRQQAEKTLQALAELAPPALQSKQAAEILAQLRAADSAAAGSTPGSASAPSSASTSSPPSERTVSDATVAELPRHWTTPSQPLIPESKWMPADVDESMPAVEAGVACPLHKVQEESGKRVAEFVDAVNRITATEVLEHESVDRYGFPSKRDTRRYTYVASVQEIQPGAYMVDEYRNGTMGLDIFPARLATLGLSSLVMIFHPAYRDEYSFTCEGLTKWHGASAWQVHFRQRPDKPARLREYRVRNQGYAIWLKGRAWISPDTFQIVSLETDVVGPIPRIRLKSEHIAIEYQPVQFRRRREQLWLPESAEIFLDFDGRRVHRRHQFSNYLLFAVDDTQQIANPSVAASTPPPAASQSNP
jgi:predicted negative regulator of RcsB-dependent stress response